MENRGGVLISGMDCASFEPIIKNMLERLEKT